MISTRCYAWQGSAELGELSCGWLATPFEALDLEEMEEAIAK
jgi:hypothetical protein